MSAGVLASFRIVRLTEQRSLNGTRVTPERERERARRRTRLNTQRKTLRLIYRAPALLVANAMQVQVVGRKNGSQSSTKTTV